MEMFDYLPYII